MTEMQLSYRRKYGSKVEEDHYERKETACYQKSLSMFSIGKHIGHFIRVLLLAVVTVYVTLFCIMYFSEEMRKQTVFLNWFNLPLFANFSNPVEYGATNTENVYLNGDQGKLGVWLMKPDHHKDNLKNAPYFLYLHGNSGSRALAHRVSFAKVLASQGYFVLSLDYRGFGDSDGFPSEEGVVSDSLTAWNWLVKHAGAESPLYIWGHSFGSCPTTGLAKRIATNPRLTGIVLEAAFNSIEDTAFFHPLSIPARFLPKDWFNALIVKEQVTVCRNDRTILDVTCPLLLVHGEADSMIPAFLGRKLCTAARQGKSRAVSCEFFDDGYDHNYLWKSTNLWTKIREFVQKTKNMKSTQSLKE